MRGFVDRMIAAGGRDGILSVSFGHGFPQGDVADVGARMLVVTDDDAALAQRTAERFGQELFGLREALTPKFLSIDEALDEALREPDGTVVIADTSGQCGRRGAGRFDLLPRAAAGARHHGCGQRHVLGSDRLPLLQGGRRRRGHRPASRRQMRPAVGQPG